MDDQFSLRSLKDSDLLLFTEIIRTSNNENITLVLFDKQIELKLKFFLAELHIDNIPICTTKADFLDAMDELEGTGIVILSGQCAKADVLFSLQNNNQVHSIHIFCINETNYKCLASVYSKLSINSIHTTYESLFQGIEMTIHALIQQLTTFTLFNQTDKSNRDLTNETLPNFLWYQLFRDYLMKITKTEESKQEMLEKCRLIYKDNSSALTKIDEFEQTYQSSEAIKWYTKDTFLFRLINKALRTEDLEALYSFRYYLIDLCTCLKTVYDEFKNDLPDTICTFYRGQTLSQDEIDKLKNSLGQLISTNGFLSTSWSLDVAKFFATNVIYEINIDTPFDDLVIFVDISSYSTKPGEQEVLFDLGATFKVIDVQCDMNTTLWKVTLSAVKHQDYFAINDYIKRQQDDLFKKTNTDQSFGMLLIELAQYHKAIGYFQKQQQQHETYFILYGLSMAYLGADQLDLALASALQAFSVWKEKQTVDNFQFAINAANLLGLIYQKQGDFDRSLELLNIALRYTPKDDYSGISRLQHNIGCLYGRTGRYDLALKQYQQVLELQTIETMDPSHLAQIYEDLGNIYFHGEDSVKTIEYSQAAFDIYEKIYPSNHPSISNISIRLGNFYALNKQYDLGIIYLKKAIEIDEKSFWSQQRLTRCGQSYWGIAKCYELMKQFDKSFDNYQKSLNVYKKYSKYVANSDFFSVYQNIGKLLCDNGQLDLACEQFHLALNYATENQNEEEIAQINVFIGKYYFNQTNFDRSLIYFRKVLHIYENSMANTFSASYLYALNFVAKIYKEQDQLDLSDEYSNKWLLLVRQRDMTVGELDQIFELAVMYHHSNEYDRAIEHYEKYLDAHITDEKAVKVCFHLGLIYFEQTKYDLAVNYFQKAIKAKQHDDMIIVQIYDCMGLCYVKKGEFSMAISCFENALALYDQCSLPNQKLLLNIKLNLGSTYGNAEQYDEAIDLFKTLLNNNDSNQIITTADLCNNIGWWNYKSGNYTEALTYCLKSKNLYEECGRVHEVEYGNILSSLGVIYYKIGDNRQAREYCLRSITILATTQHPAMKDNYQILANTTMVQTEDRWKKLLIPIGLLTGFIFIMFLKKRKLN